MVGIGTLTQERVENQPQRVELRQQSIPIRSGDSLPSIAIGDVLVLSEAAA